jgi:hypothetical protein
MVATDLNPRSHGNAAPTREKCSVQQGLGKQVCRMMKPQGGHRAPGFGQFFTDLSRGGFIIVTLSQKRNHLIGKFACFTCISANFMQNTYFPGC